jgi:hypothetical protein
MTNKVISITEAEDLGDLRLRLTFSDGVIQEVNFRSFLQHSNHPEIRAFIDAKKFATFALADGDLMWGDFELCFPIMGLYQNNINHSPVLSVAA